MGNLENKDYLKEVLMKQATPLERLKKRMGELTPLNNAAEQRSPPHYMHNYQIFRSISLESFCFA